MAHPERYYSHARDRALPEELHARGEAFKGSLARHLRAIPERTVILSAEELSAFAIEELRSLADFLMQQGRDVTYLGYVRKYKPLQESRFQEALRQGRLRGGVLTPEHPRFANFPYRSRIEKFMMLSGKDAVDLRKFERNKLKDGCVIKDFCARTGIEGTPAKSPDANAALSLEACKLLYTYRKFCAPTAQDADSSKAGRQLLDKLGELKGNRLCFHSSVFLTTEDQWHADVEWISQQLSEDMKGDIFCDDEKPCVRSESDLFQYAPQTLEWLARNSGVSLTKLRSSDSQGICSALELVRQKTLLQHASLARHG